VPTQEQWDDGLKTTACFAGRKEAGQQTNSSIKGKGAA
jgi:hypothetical protein